MATTKRMEKRLGLVEEWIKGFQNETGPRQTMENMNWLVGQTRMLGERLTTAEQAAGEMQNAIQQNSQIVQNFMEANDLVRDWQLFLEELQKESEENAVQEQETESLDVQEQAEDGEEVGEGDA
jgi:hypothetical protein